MLEFILHLILTAVLLLVIANLSPVSEVRPARPHWRRGGRREDIPQSSPACSEDPPSADGERDIEKRKRHEHARKNSGDRQGK
jgi:hypothetical protein